MINVLPIKEKKLLRKEYYLRLSTICFLILAVLSLVATSLLFPSYFLSKTKVAFFQNRLNSLSLAPAVKENDLTSIITEINTTLHILNAGKNPRDVSDIINSMLSLRQPGVTFSQISYTEQDKNTVDVTVAGMAVDRASLRSFQSALASSPLIANADVPISDFAKRSNINFSIHIKLK